MECLVLKRGKEKESKDIKNKYMKHIINEDNDLLYLSNRQKALLPRKTKFWCSCDFAIVRPWVKCPQCGTRNRKRRLLK
jgi:spore coat polysaccharide biosynthesis predicted glycosyltransferase SpsG